MTRREVVTALGALVAAGRLGARSHIARSRVSAVTDEIGRTQSDALALAARYKLDHVELRRVPGTVTEFAALTQPELKRAAAELGVAKVKVVIVHATSLTPETIGAAVTLGAARLLVANADSATVAKNLAALEAAKLQLLVGSSKAVGESRSVGLDWDPVKDPDGYVKGRVWNMLVQMAQQDAGWRRRFEALDRDGYAGGISLETTLETADDGLHDLLRLVDSL